MTWLVYDNSDEATQVFVGTIVMLVMLFVFGVSAYYWVSDKIKNRKNK